MRALAVAIVGLMALAACRDHGGKPAEPTATAVATPATSGALPTTSASARTAAAAPHASASVGVASPAPVAPTPARELTWRWDHTPVGPMVVVVSIPETDRKLPVLIAMHGLGESEKGPVTQGHVGFGTPITEGFSMSWAWAAGGLVGNVEDLCRWADRLLFGGTLSDDSLALMMAEGEHDRYGLGVDRRVKGGHDVVGHTGSTMGFNGELFVDPATGVCVAVQTNDFFGVSEPISDGLWDDLATAGY